MSEPWWEKGADKRPPYGFLPWSDWLEAWSKVFVVLMIILVVAIGCSVCG